MLGRINSPIYFPTYVADEMLDVFLCIAKRSQYTVEKAAHEYVKNHFDDRIHTKDFGNGREARNLLDACTIYLAERVIDKERTLISDENVTLIKVDDVIKAIKNQQDSFTVRNVGCENSIGFR